jgi:Resolvase, N terminal domain
MTTAPAYDNSVRIGCARVSTRAQEHQAQLDALAAAHCREIVIETASTRGDRPELHEALGQLQAGDTLVIYKPDRVARSMKELLVLLEDQLHARGSTCISSPASAPGSTAPTARLSRISRLAITSSSKRATETIRQLPGAIIRAYPVVTARAVSASRMCSTAPRMMATGVAGLMTARSSGSASTAAGSRRVCCDRGHAVAGGQQGAGVRQDHRVEVDVGDPGGGQDRPRGLVN